MWPYEVVGDVVNALTDAGHVVLGLDARERNDSGKATEIPISVYEPWGDQDDIERGRQSALAAIHRVETVTGWARPHVLLTWR